MTKVLVIDDDERVCRILCHRIEHMECASEYALSLEEGCELAASGRHDLIFLDVRLPDGNGLELVSRFKKLPNEPEIIIITGAVDPDGAEMAIESGAWDYMEKPLTSNNIALQVTQALAYRENKQKNTPVFMNREGIIGETPNIKSCLDLAAQSSRTTVNVLITGETGSGKELFARAIHDNSGRSGGSFITVDCAALPDTLAESVLFGHVKGAFTGAVEDRVGLVKLADGGSLFLDEIGELSLPLQKDFLRVLQERAYRPVGARREERSDFRLIAATHRDLERLCAKGEFRKDLLYRLQSILIHVPALRERKEDIPSLVLHYVDKFCHRYGTCVKGYSPEFLATLRRHDWPGNVRELVNVIDAAVSLARDEPTLYPIHLPKHLRIKLARAAVDSPCRKSAPPRGPGDGEALPTWQTFSNIMERSYFERLLDETDGDIQGASERSGLSRSALYSRLKKHDLSRENRPRKQ